MELVCQKWGIVKSIAEKQLGLKLDADRITNIMLESELNWNTIKNLIDHIITERMKIIRHRTEAIHFDVVPVACLVIKEGVLVLLVGRSSALPGAN